MRMSQELAKQIAAKMTEKKHKEVKRLLTEYQQFVTDQYFLQTPKEVLASFKKHAEWFALCGNVWFKGHGFDHETVSTTKRVIRRSDNPYSTHLELTKELADKIKVYKRAWEKEKEKVDLLESEIRTALYGLRTFSQIQKNLPEAVSYLPKSSSVELMINLDDLRTKIKAA